jgi:hypothetical protein
MQWIPHHLGGNLQQAQQAARMMTGGRTSQGLNTWMLQEAPTGIRFRTLGPPMKRQEVMMEMMDT